MQKHVGFIGLGDIGKPMAKRLANRRFPVIVCDIRKEPVEELQKEGAKAAKGPREVAEASDVIFIMVRDDAQTEEVIYGEGGVMEGARSSSIIVISSTVSPSLCQKVARDAASSGIGVLDAPVSGARMGAEAGTLTFMVGGDSHLLEECRPIFQAMGENIFHLGDIGMGEVVKLVNNLIVWGNVFLAAEALTLGIKAGVELEVLLEVVRASTGSSQALEHWQFYAPGKRHRDKRAPGISKDLGLAMKLAKELAVNLPIAEKVAQLDYRQLADEVAIDR